MVEQTGKSNESTAQQATGDWRLLKAVIKANSTYARALVGPGILTEDERDTIIKALAQIETEYTNTPAGDDLFEAIQTRLEAIVGPAASKLNAGRGYDEQLLTALRLWLLDEIEFISESTANVQRALIEQAEGHVGALMPGYRHFQPVQPISPSLWLLSYFWMLARDQERLTSAIGRTAMSPLGSGVLAGAPYRLDRREMAAELGFADVLLNSMDAVGDADFAAEFLFIATLMGTHLNRLAEDLTLFSNPLLGFVTLSAAQDAQEAVGFRTQSKTGRLIGELTGFLSTLRALSLADLGDNHNALYLVGDMLIDMLSVAETVVQGLTLNADRMQEALDDRILAGDLVDYLIERGETVRAANTIVKRLLDAADSKNMPLSEMSLDDLRTGSPRFDADLFATFDPTRAAAKRSAIGGTAPGAIRTQIQQALNWMMEAGFE